ncbi:hypothetical protein CBS101457_004219 [Exobasidium rhododendri]|nr:hypothetical protein CBS101457_004219 [Exobasidium rhododendri]
MRSTRRSSGKVDEDDDDNASPVNRSTRSSRASGSRAVHYEQEDDPDEEQYDEEDSNIKEEEDREEGVTRKTRSGRAVAITTYYEDNDDSGDDVDDDDDDDVKPLRRKAAKDIEGFVVNDEGEEEDADGAFIGVLGNKKGSRLRRAHSQQSKVAELASRKRKHKARHSSDYEEADAQLSGPDEEEDIEEDTQSDGQDEDGNARSYSFRRRTKKIDYRMVAPPVEPLRDGFGKKVKSRGTRGEKGAGLYELDGMERLPATAGLHDIGSKRKAKDGWNGLPLSMTGKDYDKFFGAEDGDSSDEDIPASRKTGAATPGIFGGASSAGLIGAGGGGGTAGGAGLGADLGAHRDAMGKMKGTDALADIDPLGVNMQVDFDSVGGLDQHIQQLKEMVSLPLLYPEVFQRFKVTPPRGVLFHGPPGTGKTLVARALAASCSSSGQQISFYMRKGADCLSKWVGEAERQLRLLFEEARNSQPSIIFFDEIDGLAPVRSSKQDQIHASIVSTLLALMDGMDGRGQVVVIGATNRPDSVDPALRRPGRFDREFYFPLPNREARKSIIQIQTKEWEPPLDDSFKDRLAEVTKGYGGADLRALCTEAALNAVQRRYPQIYQSTERLELKPETIQVDAKDFMMSVNKVVPSSARSSSSAAAPLAEHLKTLLESTVQGTIRALEKVMPPTSKRNPLEEALWEDDSGEAEDGGFGRELLLQSFEQLRIFRPRLVIHGKRGMGQVYVGSALLHHLEGYHVQSLDVTTLMGDSSTSAEAVVIQSFTEAKRHKPSVLYIPNLSQWADHVSESVRSTVKSLLDGLAPSDPVILLGISNEPFKTLPRDIRSWFGYVRDHRIELERPHLHYRQAYFEEVLQYALKPPNEYPDAMPKRRRILEVLPIAAPRPARVPTAVELRQQAADDARLLEHLKFRLGPVLSELKKKFPRFKRDVWQEYNLYELTAQFPSKKEKNKVIVTLKYDPDSELLRRLKANSPDEMSGAEGLRGSQTVSRGQSADVTIRGVQALPQQSIPLSQGSTNGGMEDVSMSNSEQLHNGVAVNGQMHTTSPTRESSPQLTGLGAAMSGELSTSEPPAADSTDLPSYLSGFTRDESGMYLRYLHIWTISLERMQKRLYYNGYLTVSDFLGDISRILSNAIEAQEVDEERLSRAYQLHNLAVILLDQYLDPDFRVSCERMAERMIQREDEAKKSEEKMRIEREEEAKRPRMPSGERHSARIHGEAPEMALSNNLNVLERKRSRRSSEEEASEVKENGAEDGAEMQKKKSKMDNDSSDPLAMQEVGQTILPAVNGNGSVAEHSTVSWDSRGLPLHLRPESPSSSSLSSLPSQPSFAQDSISSPIIHLSTPPTIRASSQLPSHRVFVVDGRILNHLRDQLLHHTSQFNVEQLEQLRAALFDAIWKQRKEWNRDALLKEMKNILFEIGDEVEVERKEEEELEEADERRRSQ